MVAPRQPTRRTVLGALAGLGAGFTSLQGAAQTFPSRTITMVVPFPAGGTADMVARLLGQKVSSYTGQSVIVENVPGAATMVGAERVFRAEPDGYTLLVATSTTLSTNPHLYKAIRYEWDAFEPVTMLVRHPLSLDIPKLPVSTLSEFVALVRAREGGIAYATTGRGGSSHLLGEMLKDALNLPMRDVPYRGSTPAITDLLRGEVQLYFDGLTTSLPLYRSGDIKILAVSGRERSPAVPEIPTLAELGYKDLVLENLYCLLAPKGTPRAVVGALNGLFRRALEEPDIRSRLVPESAVPEPTTPEGLAEIIKADNAYMGGIIRRLGIRLD
ncbi:MAG: hypothetical protein JWR08_1675 [Enterovirga sp.]|nr:hypothetical protein [Enterovirga sp.]